MNAIKNTIVTVTLLIVGYGAYVVLQNPPANSLAENQLNWDSDTNVDTDLAEVSTETPLDSADDSSRTSNLMDRINAPTTQAVDEFDNTYEAQTSLAAPTNDSNQDSFDTPPQLESYGDTASLPTNDADNLLDVDENQYQETQGEESYYDRENDDLLADDASLDLPSDDASPSAYDTVSEPETTQESEELKQAERFLEEQRLSDALLVLTKFYRTAPSNEERDQVVSLMDQLAGTVIYSRENFSEPAYEVKTGDTLASIASNYNLSPEFLARVNGLPADYQVIAGESIKVVRGPFRLEASRQKNEMTLFVGEYYAGRFPFTPGKDFPSGEAVFEVVEISPGREFFDRSTGYRIAKDDPSNPYGRNWIGLRGNQITAAHNVGIHAGYDSDKGCIAVNDTDARDLSMILSIGSEVAVVP